MVRLTLILLTALPWIAACGSASTVDDRFVQPNSLMAKEIANRVEQIPFQHREELFNNLLWLKQAGEQAIPSLLQGLHHEDPKVRSNSAWVLAQIGDRRVIPDIRPLTSDENPTVRLEVSRSLVQLGDIKNCPPLIGALDSDQVQVRYLCHEALKSATGRDFGFDHLSDDMQQRRRAVLAWRTWWGEMSGDPWFSKSYANQHGLLEQPAQPDAGIVPTPAAPGDETAVPVKETVIIDEPDPVETKTEKQMPTTQPGVPPKGSMSPKGSPD